ncbi:hypothetical protein G7054_g180 [Neopestalotiopsis clavispora]|nr:hypothetical protein G7054_g180 [Neopestalotiopsis clavispora]
MDSLIPGAPEEMVQEITGPPSTKLKKNVDSGRLYRGLFQLPLGGIRYIDGDGLRNPIRFQSRHNSTKNNEHTNSTRITMAEDLVQFRARLNGAAISTYILVMLIVPLKLWCRAAVSGWKGLGLDDYLCVLALACAKRLFLSMHVRYGAVPRSTCAGRRAALRGGGLSSFFVRRADFLCDITRHDQVYYSSFLLAVVFVEGKDSNLYWPVHRHGLGSIDFIFTCSPVSAQWDLTITDSKCISLGVVYVSGSTPNVITDWLILLAPIPYVARLHAPLAQRLVLASMFMLGCFVAIVSIIRLTILVGIPLSSSDVTYNTKEVIVWSTVEINIGLVSACLPSMKPALQLLRIDRLVPGVAGSPNQNQQQQQQRTPDAAAGLFPPTIGAAPSQRSKGPGGKKSKSGLGGIGRSRSRKTVGGGLFSSITGLTKLDDEEYYNEDSFQMIGQAHARHGKTEINVESSGRRSGGDHMSDDVEDESVTGNRREKHLEVDGGISVQKVWRVMRDEKRRSQRTSQCLD